MRLSEAIRKGGQGARQVYGQAVDGKGGVCALAAASRGGMELNDTWVPFGLPALCPACETAPGYLGTIVIHLNDSHFWTFDQIADWVQAQEAIHGIGQEVAEPVRELVSA